MDLSVLIKQYTDDVITEYRPIGDGHINDTFYVKGEKKEYLLQKLNAGLFGESLKALEHNYLQYVKACEKTSSRIKGWELPRWLKSRNGSFFCADESGAIWRMYEFIRGSTLSQPYDKEQIRACGEGLSKIHFILSQMEERPVSVLPGLHDTEAYYREYLSCRDHAKRGIRESTLEEIIDSRSDKILKRKLAGEAVIHGDAKIGNMIFRDGSMTAMIDLDTIMCGPRILDIADCIRSCCICDGRIDGELVNTLVSGYRDSGFMQAAGEEWEALPFALELICFELGLRYYTDHLNGNVYFKQDQPGKNLYKAGALLHLCGEVVKLQISV